MPNMTRPVITVIVIALSAYSIAKFAFFILPYARRRAALDKAYAGRPFATATSDKFMLAAAVILAAAVLATGGEPISFLGGLFVGSTMVQLFFHAFHKPVLPDREAPAPHSPLKQMSYAIQDRPILAWKEMLAMTVVILLAVVQHFVR